MTEQLELIDQKIKVQSANDPDKHYVVDPIERTCTCPAFQLGKKKPCKHLAPYVTFSANYWTGVSGLIKAFRMRRERDSFAFLFYMLTSGSKQKSWSSGRRLLAMSGEDGFSVPVARYAVHLFKGHRQQSIDENLRVMAAMLKTENWWSQPNGKRLLGEYLVYCKLDEPPPKVNAAKALADAFEAQDIRAVMGAVERYESVDFKGCAHLIQKYAEAMGQDDAAQHAEFCKEYAGLLKNDGNHIAWAAWRVLFPLPNEPVYKASDGEIAEIRHQAAKDALWLKMKGVPAYYCDGHHTRAGNDKRFAGIPRFMYGCCRAYEEYGRLDPRDQWPNEFTQVDLPNDGKQI